MGLFDYLSKSQEKILKAQEKINNKYLGEHIPPRPAKSKPKQNAVKQKPSASEQILKQKASFVRNGFKEYEFIANKSCCEICAKLNGKHFSISKLQIGVNAPPMHEGCKCSIAAYEDEEEYEAWLDYLSKGGTTKQWEALKKKR